MASEALGSTRRDLRQLFNGGCVAGLSDVQLLERLSCGRADAIEPALAAILNRHGPMVWATCLRVLADHHAAEDAFQATFLVLVRRAEGLRIRESLGPWLHTVATRIALKVRTEAARRQARERRAALAESCQPPPLDDLGPAVQEEVTRLPSKYRDPIVLCYFEGRTHDETAVTLGWPVGTVRGRLARARALLRDRLTRRGLAPDALLGTALILPGRLAEMAASLHEATIAAATGGRAVTPRISALVRLAVARLCLDQARRFATLALVVILATGTVLKVGAGAPPDPSRSPPPPAAPVRDQAAVEKPPPAEALPAPEGIVVDSQGRPVEDAAVFLSAWPGQDPDGSVATLGRALTDAQGHFRMEPPPPPAFRGQLTGTIWAYKPGLAFSAAHYSTTPGQNRVRMQLDPPGTRMVTFRRTDGSPATGVKSAPFSALLFRNGGTKEVSFPDELAELMASVSDEQGQVVFPSFPQRQQLRLLQVWQGPAIHRVSPLGPVARDAEGVELIVESAGVLEGLVRRSDGKPLEGATVRLESTGGNSVRLDGGPIRLRPDGSFRTPAMLLAGQQYRVVVQGEGYRPAVSPWVDPAGDGGTATLGELVLEPLRTVSGRVVDRQGQPIKGAEVIQSGDGPARTTARTDAAGRFTLGGFQQGPALISACAEGFRFGGRVVAPGKNTIVLTRVTEAPERSMPALRPALPAAELRTLSRRVLDPHLRAILKPTNEGAGPDRALYVLALLDPAEALATLAAGRLTPHVAEMARERIAIGLARSAPDVATIAAQSITEPSRRVWTRWRLTEDLPGDRRALRIDQLERAAIDARTVTNPDRKLRLLGDVGERLVEEGAIEKARPLFSEGLALARATPHPREWRFFAARLARVDLPEALKLIEEIPTPEGRSDALANTAIHIAGSQPAECERLLGRLTEEDRNESSLLLLVCDRLAGIDPARASRIVANVTERRERGFLKIVLARRRARGSKRDAERTFRAALADLDASSADESLYQLRFMSDLPLVEEIDPGLVPEYLWRCLSLRKPDDGLGSGTLRIRADARVVAVVAQYDRELAEPLWASIVSRLPALEPVERDRAAYAPEVVLARTHLDPRAAVAWVESRPEPEAIDMNRQPNPRFELSRLLALWSVGQRDRLLPYVIGTLEMLAARDLR